MTSETAAGGIGESNESSLRFPGVSTRATPRRRGHAALPWAVQGVKSRYPTSSRGLEGRSARAVVADPRGLRASRSKRLIRGHAVAAPRMLHGAEGVGVAGHRRRVLVDAREDRVQFFDASVKRVEAPQT